MKLKNPAPLWRMLGSKKLTQSITEMRNFKVDISSGYSVAPSCSQWRFLHQEVDLGSLREGTSNVMFGELSEINHSEPCLQPSFFFPLYLNTHSIYFEVRFPNGDFQSQTQVVRKVNRSRDKQESAGIVISFEPGPFPQDSSPNTEHRPHMALSKS